eukprot:12397-Pyramimonas_sp.AAC.1
MGPAATEVDIDIEDLSGYNADGNIRMMRDLPPQVRHPHNSSKGFHGNATSPCLTCAHAY